MIDLTKTYRTKDGHDVIDLICFSKERFLFKNDTFFGQLVPKKGERTTFVEWDYNGKAFGWEKDYLDLIEVKETVQITWSSTPNAESFNPTENRATQMTDDETKAMRDALIFGTGFMQDGKHVPMEAVMADDLVGRLLTPVIDPFLGPLIEPIKKEAADRIEELKAELAEERRSREEAQEFAWMFSDALQEIRAMTPDPEFGTLPIEAAIKVARAALAGEKKDE